MIVHFIATQASASGLVLPQIEAWAQAATSRVLNSLPEGLLIALFAWTVLHILPKQNSRTRFAVWFVALLSVVGIACLGGLVLTGLNGRILGASGLISQGAPAINLPAHWAVYLFIGWLLAASIGTVRLAAGVIRLRALRQSSVPVNAAGLDPSIRETLAELNASNSFASRSVTLAVSDHVRVPAALGLWKPMIALPAWALAELPASDLIIILRHEFAHLRRWDDWTNLLQKAVRALFFFHPAVWWIENRLSVEREMACDDVVVAQTGNPMGYASCLVSLLERSLAQRGWTMAQAIVHRAREASDRLAQILDKNRPAATGISKPSLGLVGTFAVLCIAMLPQTPQFVAFDRLPQPVPESSEYSAALVHPTGFHAGNPQTSFHPGAVIPATLKIDEMKTAQLHATQHWTAEPPSPQKSSKSRPMHSNVASDVVNRGEVAASYLVPAPEALFEVGTLADQKHPMMQTLVFVESMQFMPLQAIGSDSMFGETIATSTPAATLWRVQVWQITFVHPMSQHPRVPVANKI